MFKHFLLTNDPIEKIFDKKRVGKEPKLHKLYEVSFPAGKIILKAPQKLTAPSEVYLILRAAVDSLTKEVNVFMKKYLS